MDGDAPLRQKHPQTAHLGRRTREPVKEETTDLPPLEEERGGVPAFLRSHGRLPLVSKPYSAGFS
ncbi:MAG: hypothetical protein ACP5SI_10940, partial [Chloroflexia bacterium]